MTKKLMRIELTTHLKDGYTKELMTNNLYFAFASSDTTCTKDGTKKRNQLSRFLICREYLCGIPRSILHKLDSNYIDIDSNFLDFDSLRLLLGATSSTTNKDNIFSGKRALNLLEEAAGWTPSVITTVKHKNYGDDQVWLLTGDKRWMMAPQMLSLLGLILRLSWRYKLNTNSLEELMKNFDVFARESSSLDDHNDKHYIGTCRKHILKLMEQVNKVFDTEPIKNYADKSGTGWNGYGGIDSLIKCSTGDNKLTERFKTYVLNAK